MIAVRMMSDQIYEVLESVPLEGGMDAPLE